MRLDTVYGKRVIVLEDEADEDCVLTLLQCDHGEEEDLKGAHARVDNGNHWYGQREAGGARKDVYTVIADLENAKEER